MNTWRGILEPSENIYPCGIIEKTRTNHKGSITDTCVKRRTDSYDIFKGQGNSALLGPDAIGAGSFLFGFIMKKAR